MFTQHMQYRNGLNGLNPAVTLQDPDSFHSHSDISMLTLPLRPVSKGVLLPCGTQLIDFSSAVARRLKPSRATACSAAELAVLHRAAVARPQFINYEVH